MARYAGGSPEKEPRYLEWWLYRNKIGKMNKKQDEVRKEHGNLIWLPSTIQKKKKILAEF